MIVILSRTKITRNTIFVGDVIDTLVPLKYLITMRTQWTDYMEEILRIITINYSEDTRLEIRILTQETLLYCICDVSLTQ